MAATKPPPTTTLPEITMQAIRNIRTNIIKYFDANIIECFYPGVRADVAIAIGVAPNSPQFNAAWEKCFFTSNGYRVYVDLAQ
jgi:hypothetical protein